MIVTLTINPAIDRTISVDRLAFEDSGRINSCRESAGGRGLNASCVIHSFGEETHAVLTSGGATGKRLEEYLSSSGFRYSAVPIEQEIRTNLTITDRHGLTVKLNEAGPKLTRVEAARVERVVRELLKKASWLMVCGSIAPGVSATLYARLIAMARERKVKTLLDASGEELRQGIEAGPTVVTPNRQEAEELLGRTLLTSTHQLEAAARIRSMGAESVVLSLGSRGAIGAFRDGLYEALPPRVDALCPMGAGDALAAGFVWAMRRKSKTIDALRWSVAAGTASAQLPGMAFATFAQTEAIYQQVEVRRVE